MKPYRKHRHSCSPRHWPRKRKSDRKGEHRRARRAQHRVETDLLVLFAEGVRVARGRGLTDPEDISQLALIKAVDDFDPTGGPLESRFRCFLECAIIDDLRRQYRRPVLVCLDALTPEELPVFVDVVGDARPSCLRAVLNQFPAEILELLFLHHGLGYSVRELAEWQRIGVSALKMRLARARRRMATLLHAVGCFSADDVEELGARKARLPILIPPTRPARRKCRPNCQPRPCKPK